MKIFFVYFLLIKLTVLNLFSQDLIILKDNKDTIKCKIIEDRISIIKYQLYNSKDTSIYQIGLDRIDSYIVSQKNKNDILDTINYRNNFDKLESYIVLQNYNNHIRDSLISLNSLNDKIKLKNSIFFGLGGGNLALSLNYERRLKKEDNYFINGRIGLGYAIIIKSMSYSLSCNLGKINNYFEFGIGRTDGVTTWWNKNEYFYCYYPFIGYRYQKELIFLFDVLYAVGTFGNSNGFVFLGVGFGKVF